MRTSATAHGEQIASLAAVVDYTRWGKRLSKDRPSVVDKETSRTDKETGRCTVSPFADGALSLSVCFCLLVLL
jgi:hypothetical protein